MTPEQQTRIEELKALLERYPWYTTARTLHHTLCGEEDAWWQLVATDRATHTPDLEIDGEALLHLSSADIIDRFLKEKELRIVAEEGEVESEITTEADLEEEDDLVSEDLAEVYLQQGLNEEALAIYRRLCLLIPEKSVYFAEIIQRLEQNKETNN